MIDRIRYRLAPPVFPDDETETRRAGLLNLVLLTMLVLTFMLFVADWVSGKHVLALVVLVAAFVACLDLLVWMRRGQVRLASVGCVALGLALTSAGSAALGSIRTPTTALYFLMILIAGLLFDLKGTAVTAGLSSGAIAGLIWAENAGALPLADYSVGITQWITYTTLFWLAGELSVLGFRATRQALARADQEIVERKRAEQELRKFERAVEQSPATIVIANTAGEIEYVNPRFTQTTGYTFDEVIGKNPRILKSGHTTTQEYKRLWDTITSGSEWRGEFHNKKKNGGFYWEAATIAPVWNERGEITHFLAIKEDITERKRLAEALHEREEQYRQLVELSPDAIAVHCDGLLLFVNQAGAKMLGAATPDDLIGKPILDFIVPAYRPSVVARVQQALTASEKLSPDEGRFLRLDGSELAAEVASSPFIHGGKPALLVLVRDITERKQAEEALRASEARYRRLVEGAPDVVYTFSSQRGGIYYSPYVEQVLGYSVEQLYTQPLLWNEAIHPDDRPRILEVIREFDQGKPFDLEYRIQDAHGNWRWLRDRSIGRQVVGDEVLIEGLATDITARKRAEEALKAGEARYRLLFENMKEGFSLHEIVTDGNGHPIDYRFLDANAACEHHIGFKPQAVIGKTMRDIMPQADLRQIEAYGTVALTGEPLAFEYYSPAFNRHLRVRAFCPQRGQFATIFEDITERKQAEDALRESEDRYRRLTDNAPDIIFRYDLVPEMGLAYINPVVQSITGYTPAECYADPYLMLNMAHPDDAGLMADYVQRQAPPDHPLFMRWIGKDGVTRWMESRLVPVHDAQGQVVAVEGITRDITERKQVEAALHESEARYRQMFEQNQAVQLLIDPDTGQILSANPAAAHFYGYPRETLQQLRISDLNQLDPAQIAAEMQLALSQQRSYFVFPHRLASGEVRQVEVHSSPIDLSGQRVLYSIIHDITDRLRAEARLRRFWDLPLIGMALTSPARLFLEVNQKLADMFGYTPAEMVGMSWVDVTHPDDVAENVRLLERTLAGEMDEYGMDKRFIRRDGTLLYTHIAARCLRRVDGTVDHLALVIQDITERKQIEAALRESEEKFRTLIEQSTEGIVLVDEQGTIIEWNRAEERSTGISQAEAIGQPLWEIQVRQLPAASRAQMSVAHLKQALLNVLASGQSPHFNRSIELPIVMATGEARTVLQNIFPIKTARGYRLAAIFHDITARKQMEEALRWSQSLLQMMADSSPLAFFVVDNRTDNILYFNQRFCQIWGIEHLAERMRHRELKNNDIISDCLPVVVDVPGFAESCKPLQDEQNRAVVEDEIAFIGGRTIRRFSTQIRGSGDEYHGRFYLFEDVTNRKQIEQTLRDLNATLEQRVSDRTAELQAANLHLTELDHLKDEFLSRISHELRTPLAGILIALELLETAKPEKRERFMQRLKQATERLREMVEDVLMFSQLNLYTRPSRLELADLNNLIEGWSMKWQTLCVAHNLALQLDLTRDLPRARIDGELFAQALTRLVTNAVNYTSAGSVTVSTAHIDKGDQSWVTVCVKDTGPGITPEDLPHIFERFYRGRAAADYKTPGTGVGLSISREITEKLGGRITVESGPGQGATFTVWVPLTT